MKKQIYQLIPLLPVGRQTVLQILSALLPAKKLMTIKIENLKLRLDLSESLDKNYLVGNWDREELSYLQESIKSGGAFVDIGANQGFYSLMIAAQNPKAQIIAFEPDPYSISKFEENIQLNKIGNIDLIKKGVSASHNSLDLMVNTSGNRGGNSVLLSQIQWTNADKETYIRIECEPLYEAMKQRGVQKISSLKIDIEGYEYPVLKKFFDDAPQSMYPKRIVLEHFEHVDKLVGGSSINLLNEIGYKTYKKIEQNYLLEFTDPTDVHVT